MRALTGIRPDVLSILPDAVWTWRTWLQIGTQWVIVSGWGGVYYTGLRHESIPEAMLAAGVPREWRQRVRQGLRVMERAALEVLNSND
ncbi:MAG: DUF1799 domain-containing protein [Sulfuricellaceae bacterium]